MNDQRPNPDELLERVQREAEKAKRGKLKIFFGASAGVGKTYAMLSSAKLLRAQGLDVVIGVAETHGRSETEALLEGQEILPLKEIEYKGKKLPEFDLDGALKRHPTLILVDELAHSNVAGSRHPKRWQDVEELLAAGIDVHTTVNVQHLESLNDIVGGITGIRIFETLPDRIFEHADEVVLVDITPDELLQRLKEGKIYLPQQAERAIMNFFRKGNLIALRELALRRTADRVDDQMRIYRQARSIQALWQTRDSILVCVGPKPGSEKIVRSGSRLAMQLGVEWHAVYIETPALQRLPEEERRRILRTLKMAQELGAKTATLSGQDAAIALADYARTHNLARIIVGRDVRRFWRRSFAERIGSHFPDADVIQISATEAGRKKGEKRSFQEPFSVEPYFWATVACAIATGLAALLFPYFDLANIAMLFLLDVVLVALKYGRGPAVLAAFLSVGFYDFFFVPPRFSFAVSDVQYLLTSAVMLIVALIIGQLTANLRYQARVATHRELRLRSLYEMARDLSSVLVQSEVVEISRKFVSATFGVKAALLLADESEKLLQDPAFSEADLSIAQWCYDHNMPAGLTTDTLAGSKMLYLPLQAPMRTRGVLAVEPENVRWLMVPEQRRQLDGFSALIATALERVHYIEVAQQALVRIESERLRNSVLSALSHDLRTPLTSLSDFAESLEMTRPPLSPEQKEIAEAIKGQALRMSFLVNNLLEMARLQSGEVKLKREWHSLEEAIGSALKSREPLLADHQVEVSLPEGFPLLEFDATLIERVFCNLIENAAKYTQKGSRIRIDARIVEDEARISVSDNGPGLAPGSEESIFEKFTRGEKESVTPGVGLGLAICKAIVEAHGGKIWAENLDAGGARFTFTLPLGMPPEIDPEEEE